MTDDAARPTENDEDLGEPIQELRDLTVSVGDQFDRRVRGAIERRLLAGELLSLAWTAPLTTLVELLRAPFEMLSARRRQRVDRNQ